MNPDNNQPRQLTVKEALEQGYTLCGYEVEEFQGLHDISDFGPVEFEELADIPNANKTYTMTDQELGGLKIDRSFGQTKTGIPVFYVRPSNACFNRSRRFVGYDKMEKGIQKWFSPEVKYFEIKNTVIGSNNESNALKEFWRVCERLEIGVVTEVKEIKQ